MFAETKSMNPTLGISKDSTHLSAGFSVPLGLILPCEEMDLLKLVDLLLSLLKA